MMVVLLHPDKDDYEIVMVAADDAQVDGKSSWPAQKRHIASPWQSETQRDLQWQQQPAGTQTLTVQLLRSATTA